MRRQPEYADKPYSAVIGITVPKEIESFNIIYDIKSGCGVSISSFNDKRQSDGEHIEVELEKEDAINLLTFLRSGQLNYPTQFRLIKENIPRSNTVPMFDFSKIYDSVSRSLDLTAYNLRPDITTPIDWNYNTMAVNKLIELSSKKYSGQIDQINFASNAIHNVKIFDSLKQFSGLTKLYFNDNNITDIGYFPKLPSITTVSFEGNPVCNTSQYKEHIHSKFPNLTSLDGQDAQVFKFKEAIEKITLTARAVGSHYSDDRAFTEKFLGDFLTDYDNNRGKLVYDLYCESSYFTLAINSPDLLETYKRFSSNTLKGIEKSISGVDKIRECFESLPKTVHDFNTITYDSFMLPISTERSAYVQISMYGLCQDQDKDIRSLSFSRTLVIEVSKTNLEERRILNDLLCIKKI